MSGPQTIPSACRITAPAHTREESVQLASCWADQGVLDRYTRVDRATLPHFNWVKLSGCLGLTENSARLGPWYTRLVARAMIERGARICLNITGNERGLILRNRIGTISGIVFKTHNEHARVYNKKLTVRRGIPYVHSSYQRYYLFFIPYGRRQLRMNPLINFGKSIPSKYLPRTGRRLSKQDIARMGPHANISGITELPLLGPAVRTGRLPEVISYKELMAFVRVWMKTWGKKRVPKTIKEKIARDVGKLFVSSLGDSSAKIQVSFDQLRFPGFYARMAKRNTASITFLADSVLAPPYRIGISSKMDVDRLFIRGLLDLKGMDADIRSDITVDRDGFDLSLAIPFINARFNPFRYGTGNADDQALVTTMGGRIASGIGNNKLPSGLHLTKDKAGNVRITINLAVEHHVRTKRGDFVIQGNLRGTLNGTWKRGHLPHIVPGKNAVELRDLRILRRGDKKPLIAGTHLLISDRGEDKQRLQRLHPEFSTTSSGFIVQLAADNLDVRGARKGHLASYIHVPLDRNNRHYDPGRFSMQRMVDLAFGLVMNDDRIIRGRFQVRRIAGMLLGNNVVKGSGIEIMGNVVSLANKRVQHLLKNGHAKLLWRRTPDGKGKEFYALVRADKLGVPVGTMHRPSFDARFTLSKNNGVTRVALDRARLAIPRFASNTMALTDGRMMLGGGSLVYRGRRSIDLRLRSFDASLRTFTTRTFSIGSSSLAFWRPLALRRRGSHIAIDSLGINFGMVRLAPRKIPPKLRASLRGRISGVDIAGSLGGRWRHDLATNRGRGWLELRGTKRGDVHLRDARGRRMTGIFSVKGKRGRYLTPLFADTRWVALRIDGIDRRGGWINGQFCLRTDIDAMALKPLGVKYSDYVEWRMSHDNVATNLRAFLARAEKYYHDIRRGKRLPSHAGGRADICRRIFDGK